MFGRLAGHIDDTLVVARALGVDGRHYVSLVSVCLTVVVCPAAAVRIGKVGQLVPGDILTYRYIERSRINISKKKDFIEKMVDI